jgi:hypothetical protein
MILRSKGFVWAATRPDQYLYWSHAGKHLRLQEGEAFDGKKGDKGAGSSRKRQQEIVFIGIGLHEGAISTALDQCLLTDSEMQTKTPGSDHHYRFQDPLQPLREPWRVTVEAKAKVQAWASKTALSVAGFTIFWNLVEFVASCIAGHWGGGWGIFSFGLVSLVEVGSSALVRWRLNSDAGLLTVLDAKQSSSGGHGHSHGKGKNGGHSHGGTTRYDSLLRPDERGDGGQWEKMAGAMQKNVELERRATLAIGSGLMLLAVGVTACSISSLVRHEEPTTMAGGMVITAVSLGVMVTLWYWKIYCAVLLDSSTLESDAACAYGCSRLCIIVFFSSLLFIAVPAAWWADSVATIILALFVGYDGYQQVKNASRADFDGSASCCSEGEGHSMMFDRLWLQLRSGDNQLRPGTENVLPGSASWLVLFGVGGLRSKKERTAAAAAAAAEEDPTSNRKAVNLVQLRRAAGLQPYSSTDGKNAKITTEEARVAAAEASANAKSVGLILVDIDKAQRNAAKEDEAAARWAAKVAARDTTEPPAAEATAEAAAEASSGGSG